MTYEPQGVFAEGRTFDFGQEEGIFTPQYAKSKRGPKPKGSRFSKCEGCGNSFTITRGAVGKYCSQDCMYQSRIESRPVGFDCSRCLASVGIGMNAASRLLGVNKGVIQRSWRKEGIRAQLPKGVDSWLQHAKRGGAFRADPFEKQWWGDNGKEWMSGYTPRFPDWSLVSNRRYLSFQQRDKREALSEDEKKQRRREYSKTWRNRNPDKQKGYNRASVRKRKLIDPVFKVKDNLRHRLKKIMGKVKRGGTEHRNNLTGCSTKQLAAHLEATFKRGMTWNNYGTLWHVDHIIPCASFDHTDEKQRAQCWHWTNLRALDAKKNREKSDIITEPQMSLLLCATH